MKNTIKRMMICLIALMLTITAIPPTAASAATAKKITVTASKTKLSGKKMTLTAAGTSQLTVKYNGKKVTSKATYKSSNKKVATVSKKGKVTAKKKGSCTITIKYKTKSYKLKLTVTAKPAAHTHSYTSKVTRAATCTTAGVRTYTCSCGASYTESIPATGHSWSAWTAKTSTTQYRKCSKCNATETREVTGSAANGNEEQTGSDVHTHTYVDTYDTKTVYVWEWYGDPVYIHHCACGLNFNTGEEWEAHVFEILIATGSSNGHSQYGEEVHNDTTGHYVTKEITGPTYGKCSVCGAVDSRYVAPSNSDTEW